MIHKVKHGHVIEMGRGLRGGEDEGAIRYRGADMRRLRKGT